MITDYRTVTPPGYVDPVGERLLTNRFNNSEPLPVLAVKAPESASPTVAPVDVSRVKYNAALAAFLYLLV